MAMIRRQDKYSGKRTRDPYALRLSGNTPPKQAPANSRELVRRPGDGAYVLRPAKSK